MTIPKAVNSLKVLAELPIIVVLMYQVGQLIPPLCSWVWNPLQAWLFQGLFVAGWVAGETDSDTFINGGVLVIPLHLFL